MTSIDLKDAYYSIPIAEEHQKYLKFIWRDQLYAFTSLPMGLTSGPRIFTKVLKPIFSYLRSKLASPVWANIDASFYQYIRSVKKPHFMQYNFLSVWVLKSTQKSH